MDFNESEKPGGPPWSSRQAWQSANTALQHLFCKHPDRLNPLIETAGQIKCLLEELDSIYKKLCPETCVFCPDPCCFSADIWFDLKDLLFLHAAKLPIPIENPRKPNHLPCTFLGAHGCVLPRTSRPWICTWYMCPDQKNRMKRYRQDSLYRLQNLTAEISSLRSRLEQCFISLAVHV